MKLKYFIPLAILMIVAFILNNSGMLSILGTEARIDQYTNFECNEKENEWVCSVSELPRGESRNDVWFDEGSMDSLAAMVSGSGGSDERLQPEQAIYFLNNVKPNINLSNSYATMTGRFLRFDREGYKAEGSVIKFKTTKLRYEFGHTPQEIRDKQTDNDPEPESYDFIVIGSTEDVSVNRRASEKCSIDRCGWEFQPSLTPLGISSDPYYLGYEMEYYINNIKFHFPKEKEPSEPVPEPDTKPDSSVFSNLDQLIIDFFQSTWDKLIGSFGFSVTGSNSYVVGTTVTKSLDVSTDVEIDSEYQDGYVNYLYGNYVIMKDKNVVEKGSWSELSSQSYSHDFSFTPSSSGKYVYAVTIGKANSVYDFETETWSDYSVAKVEENTYAFETVSASEPAEPSESLFSNIILSLQNIWDSILGAFG